MSCRSLIFPILTMLPLSLAIQTANTQEVDCTLQVNMDQVATAQKDLLVNFESDLRSYINSYKWGNDDLDAKIRFTMNIFIKSVTGEDRYLAQAFIGSQRSIFGSEKSTAVARLFDDTWEFTYVKTEPLEHNTYQFGTLTSFLDYYVFIVIGFDYDTYAKRSGTPFFQKAADIANLGRSSGAKGWEQKPGSFSRVQLVEDILSPKYVPVRNALYTYHFSGLDSLAFNQQRAMSNILASLDAIGRVRKHAVARDLFINAFFVAKFVEIVDVLSTYADLSVYQNLIDIDPSHRTAYEAALKQRQ